ncbi:DMT family transporter [Kordiimonas aestuarii]|uniref:DMT family transporter n=1 Tax=Kordiimonas aestuarii TaxID=1005925 RepID=UPI0021CE7EE9|nr:DMT family transporter [Kordiimonas aestuarii]
MTDTRLRAGGNNNFRGVAYMATYALFQSLIWVVVRVLSDRYTPELLVFYRNAFGLLVILPLLATRGRSLFHTARPWLHGVRGLVACVGVYSLFYALANAPLATVVAITYLAPLFSSVIAVAFMGERANALRLAALVIGFAGMVMVAQPSLAEGAFFGVTAALLGAVMTAAAFVAVKVLSRTEDMATMVASQFVLLVPVSLWLALDHWVWPSPADFALMAFMGLGFTIAQSAMARAFASADATVVLPVDFLRLLVATVAGVVLFGEVPDILVWLGGALILAAAVMAGFRLRSGVPVNNL